MPGPAAVNDRDVIADDVSLVIGPVTIRDIFAIIATADFPLPSLDLADQRGIIDDYVANEFIIVLTGSPTDVLYSAFGVGAVIAGIKCNGRVFVRHGLPLKGSNGRRFEYFRRGPKRRNDWFVFFYSNLLGQVLLRSGPTDRDAVAD